MTMRKRRIALIAVALFMLLAYAQAQTPAPLTVFCSNGLKAVVEDLAPKFEQAQKIKANVSYGLAADFKKQIDGGASFDVAVLTPALIDDLIKSGKIPADSRAVIARSGLGLAVRHGTAKTDIASAAALKRTLTSATSITYVKAGASGVLF